MNKKVVWKPGMNVIDSQGYKGKVDSVPRKFKGCLYIKYKNGSVFLQYAKDCIRDLENLTEGGK